MRQYCLPDAKLEFVQEIRHEYLVEIKTLKIAQSLGKRVL
jgi:hypothetical protein